MTSQPVLNPRQQQLIDIARQRNHVTVDELAEAMAVTHQTIRRDIKLLCEHGILSRFHGGALFRSSVSNLPYEARRDALAKEKQSIAETVAADIPDNSSIFLDIGTTAEAVAHALLDKSGLQVVTNNVNIVSILSKADNCEIVVCGGTVRNRDLAIVGPYVTEFIKKFRVDISILGVTAIGEDGSVLDFFIDEEPMTQAIIKCGRRVLAITDHSKFGRKAIAKVAHVSQFDAVYTDASLPVAWKETLQDSGVEIRLPKIG